jgi:hypothetical protein
VGGITVDDLANYSDAPWQETLQSWADFLAGVEDNASYLRDGVTLPAHNAWSGTAAELFNDQVTTTQGGLITSGRQLWQVIGVIQNFSQKLAGFQGEIAPLLAEASENFTISPDGSLGLPGGAAEMAIVAHNPVQGAQLEEERQTLQSQIQGILARANQADDKTADELRRLMPSPGKSAARSSTKSSRAHARTSSPSSFSVAQDIAQGYADAG